MSLSWDLAISDSLALVSLLGQGVATAENMATILFRLLVSDIVEETFAVISYSFVTISYNLVINKLGEEDFNFKFLL